MALSAKEIVIRDRKFISTRQDRFQPDIDQIIEWLSLPERDLKTLIIQWAGEFSVEDAATISGLNNKVTAITARKADCDEVAVQVAEL